MILKLKCQKSQIIMKNRLLEYGIIWLNIFKTWYYTGQFKKTNIIIIGIKSQFYYIKIKIIRLIYDLNNHHLDKSKVFKIFDKLKFNNIIEIIAFINIYIYYKIYIKDFA